MYFLILNQGIFAENTIREDHECKMALTVKDSGGRIRTKSISVKEGIVNN